MQYLDFVDVRNARNLAEKFYDRPTFAHAERVAAFVEQNIFIPEQYRLTCVCLAWMHDLLEDTVYRNQPLFELTSWSFGGLSPLEFDAALRLLTKPKDMDYVSYIKRFHEQKGPTKAVNECAWWVKLADMKDHFSQNDTLTERLRGKYVAAIQYLL